MTPSKLVARRKKHGDSVIAAGQTTSARVGAHVAGILADVATPERPIPDVGLLVELLVARLALDLEAMVEADKADQREKIDNAAPLAARNAAVPEGTALIARLRKLIDANFGGATVTDLGLDGEAPRDPVLLQMALAQILDATATVTLPPLEDGLGFDLSYWVRKLQAAHDGLATAVADVRREEREGQVTLTDKNKAMRRYDAQYALTASLLSALLAFAGDLELALRVRPRAFPNSEADDGVTDDGAADAEDSDAAGADPADASEDADAPELGDGASAAAPTEAAPVGGG